MHLLELICYVTLPAFQGQEHYEEADNAKRCEDELQIQNAN